MLNRAGVGVIGECFHPFVCEAVELMITEECVCVPAFGYSIFTIVILVFRIIPHYNVCERKRGHDDRMRPITGVTSPSLL